MGRMRRQRKGKIEVLSNSGGGAQDGIESRGCSIKNGELRLQKEK